MKPQTGFISLLSVCGTMLLLAAATPAAAQQTHVGGLTGHAAAGKSLYTRYCAGCHGDDGDAQGENAMWIDPKPRDFTMATFKCRSTPSGSLPTDEDLYNAMTRGFVTTNMPPWVALSPQNRVDLVAYIKTFSPSWKTAKPGAPIAIAPETPVTIQSILHGRELFQRLECWKCHGPAGHGDGPSAHELTDSKEDPIRPYNFSTGSRFMCGTTNTDLYRIFMTGLDGSPMPSFADQLQPAEAWDLVHFLRTLQPLRTRESTIWHEWAASHGSELKPIGPEGGQ
ncbi:MAG: c-type cytochrome [Gemmatimonadales bacterium]